MLKIPFKDLNEYHNSTLYAYLDSHPSKVHISHKNKNFYMNFCLHEPLLVIDMKVNITLEKVTYLNGYP